MNKGKRIFVIWISDLTTKVLKGQIKETDTILVFAPEKTEVQDIPFFKGHDHKIHTNLENIDNVIKNIRVYAKNKNDIVYLVGQVMPSLYTEISRSFKKGIRDVLKTDTFKVIENKKAETGTDMDVSLLGHLAEMQKTVPNDMENTSEEEDAPVNEETKNTTTTDTKGSSTNKKNTRKDRRNNKNNTSKKEEESKSNEQSKAPVQKINLATLEAEVFGNQAIESTYEVEFTKLQNAKARVLHEMENRLAEHIYLYTKKKMSNKDSFKFILLLIRAKDKDNFLKSWSSQFPAYAVNLKKEEYLRLKGEAVYYGQACDMMYKEDVWNY